MIRASFEVDGEVLILDEGVERPDLLIALRYELPEPYFGDDVTPADVAATPRTKLLFRGEDIGWVENVRINGERVFSDSGKPVAFIVHNTTIDAMLDLESAALWS